VAQLLPVIIFGLCLAGWGQLLLRELPIAVAAWTRLDEAFPAEFRSSPTTGGYGLLITGAAFALLPLVG
jgi:hypothetical protein